MSTQSQSTMGALLELSITAEETARDLYRELALRFRHVPEVSAIWDALRKDELVHIQKLEEFRADLTPEQLEAPVDPSIMWKARDLQGFSVESSLNAIETLDDAYQIAHDLEHSEVNTVFEFIMNAFIEEKTQREFVVSQLRKHIARLDEFEGSAWRSGIVTKEP